MSIDKKYLLEESKVFCMFPWLHLNVTPRGDIYPCCSNDYQNPFGNTKEISLEQAFNSPKMKELRLDMLNDRKNSICNFCYKHEEAGPHSFRNYSKDNFAKYFDEIVPTTQEDGTVSEFKMRYFDIRFSNICNFKCRTCGAEFSSQWAAEHRENFEPDHPILLHADGDTGSLLQEVLTHVEHIDLAYFAGGEPLITDEHYTILEEMIRLGRTDTTLRYNTNASNIKYKRHDILELWKHFKRVELSCSIDHYGERAEYIRKGTDWGKVESNLKLFRDLPQVDFQINTVLSLFNYTTLDEFYNYLKNRDLVRHYDWHHSLYLAVHPIYYSAKSLPLDIKLAGSYRLNNFISRNKESLPLIHRLITSAISFAEESNTWDEAKESFFAHTTSMDKIRNESFWKIFPELNRLQDL